MNNLFPPLAPHLVNWSPPPAQKATIKDRATSALLRAALPLLRLSAVNLEAIMGNNTARLLESEHGFFPTRATSADDVLSLLQSLHPVRCPLVRVGNSREGAYLLVDDLDGIQACFSPGVSIESSFEEECASLGMDVYMADASVEKPIIENPRFNFVRNFIGANTCGQFINLEEWVNQSVGTSSGDLLLQMDIEGCEYESLLGVSPSLLPRFRGIVLEFHALDRLFCEPIFRIYKSVFERILKSHTCVHIHPNNWCRNITIRGVELLQMAEVTFWRRDRIKSTEFANTFPHQLDVDCAPPHIHAPIVLPRAFYR